MDRVWMWYEVYDTPEMVVEPRNGSRDGAWIEETW